MGWGKKVLRCKRTDVAKSWKWAGFALKWAGIRSKIYDSVQERSGMGQKGVEVQENKCGQILEVGAVGLEVGRD